MDTERAKALVKRTQVVAKARQIAQLMNEICELASDAEIGDLICEMYPFGHARHAHQARRSLDEVADDVITWRDAMAAKAEVQL